MDFFTPWGPGEAGGYVAMLFSPHHGDPTNAVLILISPQHGDREKARVIEPY